MIPLTGESFFFCVHVIRPPFFSSDTKVAVHYRHIFEWPTDVQMIELAAHKKKKPTRDIKSLF